MALINCVGCKKEISDTAKECPSCGVSTKRATIDKTNRKHKDARVLGGVIMAIGLIIVFSRYLLGGVVLFIGLCVYLWASYKVSSNKPVTLINCPECKKEVLDTAEACQFCGYSLEQRSDPSGQNGVPKCQLCGGGMKKGTETKTGIALFLIIVGIFCCLFIIGAIIGVPLIIIGLVFGSMNKSLWVCKKCGYQVERKKGFLN